MANTYSDAQPVTDPREQRVPLVVPSASRIGNPMPVALGLLAFQLFLFGVEWISTGKTEVGHNGIAAANTYGLIVAGVAQFVAGVICFFRGEGYRGQIAAMFGLWLCGFFFLARDHSASPLAAAWFLFALILPLAVIMVPAVVNRIWPFVIAFTSILGMCVFGGLGFVGVHQQAAIAKAHGAADFGTAVTLLHVAAVLAWVCVLALVWLMVEDLNRDHGILRARAR